MHFGSIDATICASWAFRPLPLKSMASVLVSIVNIFSPLPQVILASALHKGSIPATAFTPSVPMLLSDKSKEFNALLIRFVRSAKIPDRLTPFSVRILPP